VSALPRFAGSDLPAFAAAALVLAASAAWYGTFESRFSPEAVPKLRVGGMAAAVLGLALLYALLVTALGLPPAIASVLFGVQLAGAAIAMMLLLLTAVDLSLLSRFRWVKGLAVLLATFIAFVIAVQTFTSHGAVSSPLLGFIRGAGGAGVLSVMMAALAFTTPLEWLVSLELRQRAMTLGAMAAVLLPLVAALRISNFVPLEHQHTLSDFVGLGSVLVLAYGALLFFRAVLSLPGASAYERKLREIDAVYDFGLAAGTAFDADQLQTAILKALLRVSEPDVAVLVEPDPEGPGMRCVLLRADGDTEQVYRYGARTPWKGLVERFADRRPVVIVDHRRAPLAGLEKVWEPSAGSSVLVPVLTQDGEPRALLIAGRFETHAFDASEVRSAKGFANQVALALEHARLLRDTVEAERRKKELEIARELQLNLLPEHAPQVPGLDIAARSEPASEVGGDYYDYLTLRNGNTAVVVGDVAGHGMPAGMLMAMAKSAIHTQIQSENPPTVLMERLTQTLRQMSADNQFMTMVFAELDLRNSRLVYSNAGHHYPLHFRSSTGTVADLPSTGLPLGLLPVPPGPFVERELEPGDVLLLYSDGVVEATNRKDEMFGTSRLGDLLVAHRDESAMALVEQVFRAVRAFTDGVPMADDATVLVVKWVRDDAKETADVEGEHEE
jgi:serine phosphatase RsbU (regulator of sigma subunit)